MSNISSIILLVLFLVYIFGVTFSFIRSYFYRDEFTSNSSSNICVIFLDSLLWPSYLVSLIFCVQNNNSIERQQLNQNNNDERL